MTVTLKDDKIVELAKKTISRYKLCNNCLGRLFARLELGSTNEIRGKKLRENLVKYEKIQIKNCWLCSGLFDEIQHFVDIISDHLYEYEFETFLIGSKVEEEILEKEQELLEFIGSEYSEPLKMELNREIGKILEKRFEKKVDFEKPNIMIIIDTSFDVVNLQIKPIYIYGRYNKYKRGIPQTRWFCRICHGKGCRKCDYTGKMYETSVEELIAKYILEKSEGDNQSFHGCGREDIDVCMLGNGRPFILEIKNPKNRGLNLEQLEKKINEYNKGKIKVNNLRFSSKEEIARIKTADFKKLYRITLIGEKAIKKEKLKKVAQTLRGKTISQFTPSRVARRRGNLVRVRKIYNLNIESIDGAKATLTIETQSGTYIKELISGDDGRTSPSISEMIGFPCKPMELDVIAIKGE